MENPSIPKTRWIELALISKAFLHQIATHEPARQELLKAIHPKPPPHEKPPTDRETALAYAASIAEIVNRHLGLNEIKLGLQPLEMDAFNSEMQKRHSETATPNTFLNPSFAYSSLHNTGIGKGSGEPGSTGQQSGGNAPNPPNET